MPERRNLRDKATSAAKSVAGTLKQGAQNLKSKAETIARDEESGVSISEVEGQYLVIDSDGSAIGPYDDKMKAASKARELKREKDQGAQARESASEQSGEMDSGSQGRVQKAATRFSQGVNDRLGVNQESEGDSRSAKERFDEFATNFAQGVNGTQNADGIDADEDAERGPSLQFLGDPDNDGTPELAFTGDTDGDGQPELAFLEPNSAEENTQPQFPGFGGDGEGGPSLPGFGGQEGDESGPQFPGMMGGGPDMGALPFGTQEDQENQDDPQYPWF